MTSKMVAITGNSYPVHHKIKALSSLAYWHKGERAWMVPEEHAEAARALVAAVPPKPQSKKERPLSARMMQIEELRGEIGKLEEQIATIENGWLAEVAKLKRKRANTLEIGCYGCESLENTENRCVFVAGRGREECLFCGLPSERK